MANVTIKPMDNGPLMVEGEVTLVDGEGKNLATKEKCFLCRCGLSGNAPYCNGAHDGQFNNQVRA